MTDGKGKDEWPSGVRGMKIGQVTSIEKSGL
jgi:hypothetical protein